MKFRKIVALFSILTILFVFTGCTNTMNLSLNVKKGDKYNIHEVVNQQTTMTLNNQDIKTNQIMDMNFIMDVIDVDTNKNVTIDYKYDSIKISSETAGVEVKYDSINPDSTNPMDSIYGSILGKGFTLKLDSKGQVLELKGVEELLNSITDKIPGDNEQKKTLKSFLAESFGDDAIKSMINQTMNYYPQNKVKNNDTWENQYSVSVLFPMTVNNKFTLLGEKNRLLNLDVHSTITADTKDKPIDIMGARANAKLNGDCKGTVAVNKETGLISRANLTQNMSGDFVLLSSESVPQKFNMPVKVTANITYETTKK